jgi:hypothetical protein
MPSQENLMQTTTPLGANKTGVQTSPFDAARMQDVPESFLPLQAEASRGDLEVRRDYAMQSDGLGSVPIPGTLRGMVASGVDMLTGKRPQTLVDKLGERAAFERGGVRLYDSLIAKCEAVQDGSLPPEEIATLHRFRNEEAAHFAVVVETIERLGADPTAQTPSADLVGMESMGLLQAMNDPRTSLVQSLHVLLDAELLDNAAWEMLIGLARSTDHGAIADDFETAARQEAEHLAHLRAWVSDLTVQEAMR